MLAHNCSVRRVGFSFDRLYSGMDPDYEACLNAIVGLVSATEAESKS